MSNEEEIEARDLRLLREVQRGDGAALDALIQRYWTALVSYASRLLGDWDAGQDAVQEAFVRLWEHRERWSREGLVRALLYQVTRNVALDERRRTRTRARLLPSAIKAAEPPTPADELDGAEVRAAFQAAVGDLPGRRREVFLLARFDGLSHREIADVMGIALPTVANHLGLALAELRHRMKPFVADHPAQRSPRLG